MSRRPVRQRETAPPTVLVTGAESGIGCAAAIAFGASCARVAVTYFEDRQAAIETCHQVEAAGGIAEPIKCDVGDEHAVEAAFDRATDRFGVCDTLVNSAGVNQSAVPVAQMTSRQWHRMFATDLDGVFFTMRRFVRDRLAAGGGGSIVNVGSIHGTAMRAGAADYCAAKAGLEALTRVVALEVADHGINANVVAPGMILTPMNQHAVDDARYRRRLERNIPAGRAGTAEEVADLIRYLATPAARYITGSVVTIDGALSLLTGQGA